MKYWRVVFAPLIFASHESHVTVRIGSFVYLIWYFFMLLLSFAPPSPLHLFAICAGTDHHHHHKTENEFIDSIERDTRAFFLSLAFVSANSLCLSSHAVNGSTDYSIFQLRSSAQCSSVYLHTSSRVSPHRSAIFFSLRHLTAKWFHFFFDSIFAVRCVTYQPIQHISQPLR